MSWFGRESPLRSSFSRRKYSFTPFQKINEVTCLEVFKTHWQQSWSIMTKYGHGRLPTYSLGDDISTVVNVLDQMTTLLLQETLQQPATGDINNHNSEFRTVGPILDFFLAEGCLDKLLTWSTHTGEYVNLLKLEQLKLYEVLVTNCHQDLLFHKPVVRPLLRLLSSCRECAPVEVEKRLVILLNSLCVSITQFPDLLQVFFRASSDHGATRSENPRDMFLIFSLLIPFVHREGSIGQQARDALLLCMSLSRKNESIGLYIAEHSNFCPVLATGLSGLYSVLPRKVSIASEDWHCFTQEDITETPEVAMFLNSLEFCNAVIQVAHPMVQEQLLEYLYQGFLVPVLGPALHQDAVGVPVSCLQNSSRYLSTVEEIIATTAYLELFLRTITEPILLQVFLKFILTSSHDDHDILNTLIDRLGAQGQLCLVTMALFHRLLDLNCEDVLFQLVLRFLIPCCHVMVSQRSRIRDVDAYISSADKFLALIPNCCSQIQKAVASDSNRKVLSSNLSRPVVPGDLRSISFGDKLSRGGSLRLKSHHRSPSTNSLAYGELDRSLPLALAEKDFDLLPELYHSSYTDYLKAAHESIRSCTLACRTWSSLYDGCDPPPDSLRAKNKEIESCKGNSHLVIVNGFHTMQMKRTESDTQNEETCHVSHTLTDDVNELSSDRLVKGKTSTTDLVLGRSGQMVPCFTEERENSVHVTKDKICKSTDILHQLTQTDDENDFWSLINSTDTPSSASDLDDSLESIESYLQETEAAVKWDGKSDVNNLYVSGKEENSNMDSGVFESRESNSSSDRDCDADTAVTQTGAKLKTVRNTSAICPIRKDAGSSLVLPVHKIQTNSNPSWELFGSPDVGPFLSILLTRLEMMMQNDVYTNLHLTGLIARLACYPQPLLCSFLLNHSLVFQPTVRSLLQVLGSLKHKVDSYSCTVENFDDLVFRSRQFLLSREDQHNKKSSHRLQATRMSLGKNEFAPGLQRGEPRRRSLTSFLFRRGSFLRGKVLSVSREPYLESISDSQGYRFVTQPTPDALEGEMESVKIKNAVFCAVVLEEFLKELAAIAHEHSIIQLDPDFWDEKWQLFL